MYISVPLMQWLIQSQHSIKLRAINLHLSCAWEINLANIISEYILDYNVIFIRKVVKEVQR